MTEKMKGLLDAAHAALRDARHDLRKAELAFKRAKCKVKSLKREAKKPPKVKYTLSPPVTLSIGSKDHRREHLIGEFPGSVQAWQEARRWQLQGKQAYGCLMYIRKRDTRQEIVIGSKRNFPGLARLAIQQAA